MGAHRAVAANTFGLGVVPVGRQAAVATPAGGDVVDEQAREAIKALLAVLANFGFVDASPPVPDVVTRPANPRRGRKAAED